MEDSKQDPTFDAWQWLAIEHARLHISNCKNAYTSIFTGKCHLLLPVFSVLLILTTTDAHILTITAALILLTTACTLQNPITHCLLLYSCGMLCSQLPHRTTHGLHNLLQNHKSSWNLKSTVCGPEGKIQTRITKLHGAFTYKLANLPSVEASANPIPW